MTWSAHISMLFGELPLVDRPAAARDAGFAAIESWSPGEHADAWADAVERAGIPVALLNANAGDLAAGERGFLNIAERQERELARIGEAVALAAKVGCRCVNVLVGKLTDQRPQRPSATLPSTCSAQQRRLPRSAKSRSSSNL